MVAAFTEISAIGLIARRMKRALALAALLALSACSDSPAEIQAKARAAYAAHDFASARIHLANALTAEPDNRDLLMLQAHTLLGLGDGDGAGTALAKLAGNAPPAGELAELSAEAALLRRAPDVALSLLGDLKTPEAERLRALAAIQRKDLPGAGKHFAGGLAAGGNARLFADYARYNLLTGDTGEARKMIERARKADPDGIDTLLVEGQLALRDGDLARGLDRYARAAELYPASIAALTGKAAALGDLGRVKEMEEALGRASAFAPKDPTIIYLKARAMQSRKDWSGLKGLIQPLETTLPQLHPARMLYGEALFNLGQAELAMAQLRPFTVMRGGNRQALMLLAQAQLAAADTAGAVSTLKPLADSPTATREELALVAKAMEAAGDPAAARFAARSRITTPQSFIRDLAEGDAAVKRMDWAKAIVAYDRILKETDGRNVMVLNNMAYSQLMVGNLGKASDYAARALKEAPANASVLDTAGWVKFRQGKRQEAVSLLRQAAQKAPNNKTIRAHLAEAERAAGA